MTTVDVWYKSLSRHACDTFMLLQKWAAFRPTQRSSWQLVSVIVQTSGHASMDTPSHHTTSMVFTLPGIKGILQTDYTSFGSCTDKELGYYSQPYPLHPKAAHSRSTCVHRLYYCMTHELLPDVVLCYTSTHRLQRAMKVHYKCSRPDCIWCTYTQ